MKIEEIILALVIIQMLPKAKFIYDDLGIRLTIQYSKFFYKDKDYLEGWYTATTQMWLKKNNNDKKN
jgi:hypothetical protein